LAIAKENLMITKFNQEHYNLLQRLSKAEESLEKEKFRKDVENTNLLLEGANLKGLKLLWVNLTGAVLRNANLVGANLTGVNFTNADLNGANLSKARLCIATLQKTNLKTTNFSGADLSEASIWDVNLSESNIKNVKFHKAEFAGVDLKPLDFNGIDLSEAYFSEEDLSETNFNGADLSKVDLSDRDLKNAQFENTHLYKANLSEAYLNGANLNGAELSEADLRCADLTDSNLSYSHLMDANLNGAILKGANLNNADLTTSKLIGTIFKNADITGAKLYGTTREDWNIERIKCNHVYWDSEGIRRMPPDRNFKTGEFENLYKHLPEIEYYFSDEFTPVAAFTMDKAVNTIGRKHPQFDLKLDSFHSRGQPHATFTIIHKEYADEALKEVTYEYEKNIKKLEGANESLLRVISMLTEKPNLIQNAETIINDQGRIEQSGNTFNTTSNRDTNIATDYGTVKVTNTSCQDIINLIDKTISESNSNPDDVQDAKEQLDKMAKELDKPEPNKGRLKRCYNYVIGVIPKVAEVVPWKKLIEKTLEI